MLWIKSHASLGDHPKTRRLARNLNISIPQAVGHLHMLWWWVLRYASDGNLAMFEPWEIADAAQWEGDPEEFVQALLDCGPGGMSGFLDETEDGLAIHDWQDSTGDLVQQDKKNAERQRRWRERQKAMKPDEQGDESTQSKVVGTTGSDENVTHNATVTSPVTLRNRGEEKRREERRKEETRGDRGSGGKRRILPPPDAEISPEPGERPSSPEPPGSRKAKAKTPDPIPWQGIRESYNAALGKRLQPIKSLTEARKKAIRARCGESAERRSAEWWCAYWDAVRGSPFLLGKNDRNWQADFDWLLKESNMAKVLEGKYRTEAKARASPGDNALNEYAEEVARMARASGVFDCDDNVIDVEVMRRDGTRNA